MATDVILNGCSGLQNKTFIHNCTNYTTILEIFIYEIFKFSSELIFVGGTTRQYTWQYKFKFSGKLIFIEGTTYENFQNYGTYVHPPFH